MAQWKQQGKYNWGREEKSSALRFSSLFKTMGEEWTDLLPERWKSLP